MKNFIFPSFGMNIERFDTKEKVILKGENNWYILISTHFLITILIALIVYYFRDFLSSTVISRVLTFLSLYTIVQIIYSQIKAGRNENYIKREIRFEKDGIHLNHSKNSKEAKLITKERIRRIVLITNGIYFKFAINSSDKPDFQFYIKPNEQNNKFDPEEFIKMISEFYDLEGNGGFIGNARISMMLTRVQSAEDISTTNNKLTEKNLTQLKKSKEIEERNDPQNENYKPKHLFKYGKNGEWMVEQRSNDDVIGVKKLRISRKDKLIWHKKNVFKKEEFKFNQITSFDYKLHTGYNRDIGKYIEGHFYVLPKNGKKTKVFTVYKSIYGQPEIAQIELARDFEYLKEIIIKEIT